MFNDNVRMNELASLRIACYIAPGDFFKGALKTAKKKNDQERVDIISEIGKLRGFLSEPVKELKCCYWYE